MSAAAPVVDVVIQLEPGAECAPCAKLAEHKPAVALHGARQAPCTEAHCSQLPQQRRQSRYLENLSQ